ncbi:MAG: hypothetical protein KKE61_13265, partial [Proteobacteria bacterium]|nr:hypothetical protein [Pseudomonadota bacterium]
YENLRYDGNTNDTVDISEWGPVVTSSFTKTITPGTKCGYIIVPKKYVAALSQVVANTRINPNLPTQAFIADFIQSGHFDDYLKYLCALYRPRMAALNHALNANFPGGLSCVVTGGFFATLTLPNVLRENETDFIEAAQKNGVSIASAWDAVAPDLRDDLQKKGLYIRLTFPACKPENIELGISRLKETAKLFNIKG